MRKLLLILLFVTCPVFAAGFLASWTIPTERVDGSPLAIDEIGGYLLKYRIETDLSTWTKIVIADPNAYQYEVKNLTPGTYIVTIGVFDTDGRWSDDAVPVSVAVTAEVAKPERLILHLTSTNITQPLPDEIIKLCEEDAECTVETIVKVNF